MNVKNKYLVLFVLILSASLTGFIVLKTSFSGNAKVFRSYIYKYEGGYGYSISYNNKTVIKQNAIPAIQTNQPFCDFNDAQKVANLVKEKLNNKESPNISLQELKDLNIQLECSK